MACLFCEFVKKNKSSHLPAKKDSKNKYPFIPIYQNKEVLCFLGRPNNNYLSDLLIIPKKHYKFIEDTPKQTLHKLIETSTSAAKILRKKYGGSNILLNNGNPAEQWVPHVHFHIIPKISKKPSLFNKHVGKNPWKKLSIEEFPKISHQLIKDFKTLKKTKN
jgi:histidine triad (HIT) family protein